MTDWHFYEPANGHGLRHDPLNAIVAPRPIGWISTVAEDGSATWRRTASSTCSITARR